MGEKISSPTIRSKAEWAAIMEAQERSGVSAASFCKSQGIVYHQFLYRREFLKKSSPSSTKQPPLGAALEKSSRSGGFIPIHMEDTASVRIRFPMGLILECDRIPSAAWVVELAKRWEGSSC